MATTALVGGLMASAALPVPGWAQDTVTPIAPPQQAALPPGAPPLAAPIFTQPQLESMLAPIALYPDPLLSNMLMAAAYPDEVAAADQWVHEGADASLRGDALANALAPVDWDPSVKSLVPFPQVLDTMAQHMDWTQDLGEAFVDQQADVMNVVQGLRQRAQADGDLRSTPQLAVASTGGVITIEPAVPNMVYVPIYDPAVVYGPWMYPVAPVVIYPPRAYAAPIIFGVGFAVVAPLWGWNHWDWAHHRVWVEPARINVINARLIADHHRERFAGNTWHVDVSRAGHGRPAFHSAAAVAPHPQGHPGPSHSGPAFHGPQHPATATARHAAPQHHAPVERAAIHRGPERHAPPAHQVAHAPAHAAPQGHAPSHAQAPPRASHGGQGEHGHDEHHDDHH